MTRSATYAIQRIWCIADTDHDFEAIVGKFLMINSYPRGEFHWFEEDAPDVKLIFKRIKNPNEFERGDKIVKLPGTTVSNTLRHFIDRLKEVYGESQADVMERRDEWRYFGFDNFNEMRLKIFSEIGD